MASTPILPLAVWQSGTNQNSIPANDNALRLEALNREIISQAVTAQPASPADGDTYIIAATHTGAQWASFTPKDIAIYRGGTWYAWAPTEGLIVNVAGTEYKYDGGSWTAGGGGSGSVTSVDASGGVETSTGAAITTTGTVRGAHVRNAQTGTTYTVLTADRGKLLTFSNAAAVAVTLPQATSTFGDGWFVFVKNLGAGTATITPTTSTIGGAASLALTTGQWAMIVSDGTNYNTLFVSSTGGGSLTNFTEAVNNSSPNATIPVVSLTATNAATNVDFALIPKGSGSLMLAVPDGTTTGGNKRGTAAIDLQFKRSANTQVAGVQDAVAIGQRNTVSIIGGIAIGDTHTVSGSSYGSALGGFSNVVSGYAAVAIGGQNNTADGFRSITLGGQYLSTRGINGVAVFGTAGATVAAAGKRQAELYAWAANTVNATATKMGTEGTVGSTTNQAILANNAVFALRGTIVARQSATGDAAAWSFDAACKRTANAASTALLGTPTVTLLGADAGAAAWAVAIVADTTNGGLSVQVTGEAAKTIVWTASAIASYAAA